MCDARPLATPAHRTCVSRRGRLQSPWTAYGVVPYPVRQRPPGPSWTRVVRAFSLASRRQARDGRKETGLRNRGAPAALEERRSSWIEAARHGVMADVLGAAPGIEVGDGAPDALDEGQALLLAVLRLQDLVDYRGALQAWFQSLRLGGRLVVVTPHAFLYERQLGLPSRWRPGQRRLYTPASLLQEVEEALAPNSYRVRHLSDLDEGYDYALDDGEPPAGQSEVVLVLEKIAPPAWPLLVTPEQPTDRPRRDAPDYAFEPPRTRVEVETRPPLRRILILKPDHLGDFIMGVSALERARTLFRDAEITLVVGSWNVDMARSLGVADRIIPFDVFPRNSSEEEVDVPGKAGLFQQVVTEAYDLAVDLRTDHDTRFLVRLVKAGLRAGIGTHAEFPFLDIFLPVDFTRGEPEAAREFLFDHKAFSSQGSTRRTENRIVSHGRTAERDCAVVWGPYQPLRAGRYIFEPRLDVEPAEAGAVMLDIALDATRTVSAYVDGRSTAPRLHFAVEGAGARFEFRIWTVDDMASVDLSFFGGRLIREGAASVLHQSEYLSLLLELTAMRLQRTGVLAGLDAA